MLTKTTIESYQDSVHNLENFNDCLDWSPKLEDLDICKMYASFLLRDAAENTIDNMSEGALYALRTAYENMYLDSIN